MKKFTVIWNDVWRSGSHTHSATKCTRIEAESIQKVMLSEYGQRAQFIFEGHPFMEGMTELETPIETIR